MAQSNNSYNAEYGGLLPPHPLICGLAVGAPGGNLEDANRAAAYSLSLAPVRDTSEPETMSEDLEDFPSPQRMQVVMFAGYLGPTQTQADVWPQSSQKTHEEESSQKEPEKDSYEKTQEGDSSQNKQEEKRGRIWQLLYQDPKAMTWLLVPQDGIVLHHRARDRKAAFGLRDVIWVRADAPVRQGDYAESQQARFLVGTFTSAGDLHASLTGAGALAADSGILCAPTPDCCGPHTHK